MTMHTLEPVTRRQPVERLAKAAQAPTWDDLGFTAAELTELRTTDLSGLIATYRHAEDAMRDVREQLEELALQAPARVCVMCGKPITGRVDKVVCSGRCRMRLQRRS